MREMQAQANDVLVERLGPGDVVAFAQCAALDVTVFPYPSIPAFGVAAIWVARGERGGAVSGFIVGTCRGRALEIPGLAVAPELRRRGAGRALLRAAVDGARAHRLRAVLLQVSTANRGAVALYRDEGFVPVRRLRGFYRGGDFGDGGDAWAMMLALGST